MDNIVTVLNKDERFAVYWCYNRAMDYVEKHSPNDPVYGTKTATHYSGKKSYNHMKFECNQQQE